MIRYSRVLISTLLCCVTLLSISAQGFQPPSSTAEDRSVAFEQREALKKSSPFNNIPFTNVGPTVMSGRVVDIAVNPENSHIFYVAYASGGLWKTTNNGTSFEPIFDNEAVMTLGAVDVHWATGTIYVGTGEVNSSRSSYAGLGVYKSKNDGKTWTNVGLKDSHHIGRVIISQANPDHVVVAALGHLYSENDERGAFVTTDGGNTWKKSLFIDKKTGVVDIAADPSNPSVMYAASWQRERKAWNFVESGEGSAIYKSEDAGQSWKKVTTGSRGFPVGEGVGRIGLSVHNHNGVERIYALLDNYNRRPEVAADDVSLQKDQLRDMSKEAFLALQKDLLGDFLRNNRFDRKYTVDKVKSMVKEGEIMPVALVEFVEDANSVMFDTQVIGAEVYVSIDGGESWKKTNEEYLDFVYNSYGYYFGMIDVSPVDPDQVYIAGVPILSSSDGGKTWKSINRENVHSDHHSLWIDPKLAGHLINGNDGGVNISYDDGETWIKCNSPSVGQFYSVNVDNAEPYNIYGGLQDNGVWYGPSTYQESRRWHSSGNYPFKGILGGDGMQVQIDSRDNDVIYAGSQYGNYARLNKKTGDRKRLNVRHDLGERPLRWNWQAPILLSSHNQDVFYMGSNILHRSMDQGDSFTNISEDLTNGGRKGDVAYGTLATIDESPFRFGLIYTGSDDGVLQVTKDGGHTWARISDDLPQDMWVSRVLASKYSESRVYASLNGYRWDDFTPYLYMSDNYGKDWTRMGDNLPLEAINVVKEDPVNEDVLYVGTDHGLYVSVDRGASFTIMSMDLPAVPVHDLVIQEREKEIVLGTHGRSFYKASVAEIQGYEEIKSENVHLFALEPVRKSQRWGSKPSIFRPDTEPSYEFSVYSSKQQKVALEVMNADGSVVQSIMKDLPFGISMQTYNLTTKKGDSKADDGNFYLAKGKYTVQIGGSKQELEIK